MRQWHCDGECRCPDERAGLQPVPLLRKPGLRLLRRLQPRSDFRSLTEPAAASAPLIEGVPVLSIRSLGGALACGAAVLLACGPRGARRSAQLHRGGYGGCGCWSVGGDLGLPVHPPRSQRVRDGSQRPASGSGAHAGTGLLGRTSAGKSRDPRNSPAAGRSAQSMRDRQRTADALVVQALRRRKPLLIISSRSASLSPPQIP